MPLKSQVGAKHWNATVYFVPEPVKMALWWRFIGLLRGRQPNWCRSHSPTWSGNDERRISQARPTSTPIGGCRWPTVRVSRCSSRITQNRADGADHQRTRRIGEDRIGESRPIWGARHPLAALPFGL